MGHEHETEMIKQSFDLAAFRETIDRGSHDDQICFHDGLFDGFDILAVRTQAFTFVDAVEASPAEVGHVFGKEELG
jgi:hypothetical protein